MKFFEHMPHMAPDEGGEAGGSSALDGLLNNFNPGGDQGTTDQPPANEAPPQQDPPPGDNPGDSGDNNQDPLQQNQDPKNAAFANLRVQNKQFADQNKALTDLIKATAKSMGIESEDLEEITQQISAKNLEGRAKDQNVPVELLQRLEQLEKRDQVYTQREAQVKANDAFTSLVKEFNLSEQELVAFGKQLDDAGINPFADGNVNVREKFVAMNLTLIVDKQVQAALKRDAEGSQHGSTPGDKSGGQGDDPKKITTQQGLNQLLSGMNL